PAAPLVVPIKDPIVEPKSIDFSAIVANRSRIDQLLPQRHEMQQLTAILRDDVDAGIVVGYKDLSADEFWVRGHMPGMPLMPGVIMCEAAAQVCSYHVIANGLMEAEMIGFGGMDNVRFRSLVRPGDRLVIAAQKLQLRPKTIVRCRFQCFVGEEIACEGEIRGIPIPVATLRG
ncbi:MAG: 3-hydroxyacyl-ACP dehydratase FabZ family protein, partial [Planctomycetota bacterium]